MQGLTALHFFFGETSMEDPTAIQILRRKLSILKQDAADRNRLNLKGYIEECLALLDMIEREQHGRTTSRDT